MTNQAMLAVKAARTKGAAEAAPADAPSPHYRGEEVLPFPDARRVNSRLVSLLRPNSAEAAGYYRLRLSAENLPRTDGATVLAVTSAKAGEGKTLTAINLAGALARNAANRVLLVELDIRQPSASIARYLGVKRWPMQGVVEYLSNKSTQWKHSVYYMPKANLYVMPVEKRCDSPYELLGSPRLGELLSEARKNYDYVVVDTSPITIVPDTQLVARWVDRFMVVVTADITTQATLDECLDLMAPEQVMGLVFNGSPPTGGRDHGYF